MKAAILFIACTSIIVGIACGIAIVLSLCVGRRNKVVSSLVQVHQVIGLFGTVEIPFNAKSKGKVRVNVKGSTVEFVAITDELRTLNKGEKVFIVEMKGNQVLVVSENSF
jgi:membrane protein implicated in regulation of membrane protease activity